MFYEMKLVQQVGQLSNCDLMSLPVYQHMCYVHRWTSVPYDVGDIMPRIAVPCNDSDDDDMFDPIVDVDDCFEDENFMVNGILKRASDITDDDLQRMSKEEFETYFSSTN